MLLRPPSFKHLTSLLFPRFRSTHTKHSTPTPTQSTDPLFNYTSGHWLWNSRSQLSSRYRPFNVSALQHIARTALGASSCTSIRKIGEGAYAKAFRLTMDDGRSVVAKMPHAEDGCGVRSEVASMEFAREVLGLEVPRVVAWSAEGEEVGAEYVVMEEAVGRRLCDVWRDLALRKKCEVVRELVEMEGRVLKVVFEKLGSLYFRECGVEGCEPAVITGVPSEVAAHVKAKYCIGPIARREFYRGEREDMPYHGPWPSATLYLESITQREIDWISTYADAERVPETSWQYTSDEQHSPTAHVALLRNFLTAIPHVVPKDPQLVSPRLWHPDLHAGNIYIDDQARISEIIDWQGAWTSPVFLGAKPPALLDYSVDLLMKLPDNFKELDPATKEQLRYQVAQSILIHEYETQTAQRNPPVLEMLHHTHGQTLKNLEAFAGSTWENCLYPFEECLMQVQNEWDHFYTEEPCPFQFLSEQISKHEEEAETFNKSQELWKGLEGVLTQEGYTANETFDEAVEMLKQLREIGLENLEGGVRKEFEVETRWVGKLGQGK